MGTADSGLWSPPRVWRSVCSARVRPSATALTCSRWLGLAASFTAHGAPVARGVGALGAEVVLHVAGGLARVLVARLERHVALELGQDRLGRAPDHARDEGEPAAVGHAHDHVVGALVADQLDDLVGDRDQGVHALDGEGLLAEVGAAQEALERVHLDQAVQRVLAVLGRGRLGVAARLDHAAQPQALAVVGEVLDLVRDRPAVGLAQLREGGGEALARHLHAQQRGRDAGHDLGRQAHGLGQQRRVAGRLGAQRVEVRGQVAVAAVRLDHRDGRGDALEQRFVDRARRGGRGGRRGGGGRLDDGGAGGQADARADVVVEAVRALRAGRRSRRGRPRSRHPGSRGGRRCWSSS